MSVNDNLNLFKNFFDVLSPPRLSTMTTLHALLCGNQLCFSQFLHLSSQLCPRTTQGDASNSFNIFSISGDHTPFPFLFVSSEIHVHTRDTTTSEHGIKFAGKKSDKPREPSRGSSEPRTARRSGETEDAGGPRDGENPGETDQDGSTDKIPGRRTRDREDPGIGGHFTMKVKDPEWSFSRLRDPATPRLEVPSLSQKRTPSGRD